MKNTIDQALEGISNLSFEEDEKKKNNNDIKQKFIENYFSPELGGPEGILLAVRGKVLLEDYEKFVLGLKAVGLYNSSIPEGLVMAHTISPENDFVIMKYSQEEDYLRHKVNQ